MSAIFITAAGGTIGPKALYYLFGWLLSAIVAQYLSSRKGYGEKWGLASGLIVPVVGPIVWLFIPARANSKWRVDGPIHRRRA
jgi:fucose permease